VSNVRPPHAVLNRVKDILWNALKNCENGGGTNIKAMQSFPLDVERLKQIGDRPIIINNMNMNISVKLQNAVHTAIRHLDKLDYTSLNGNYIQTCFDNRIPLRDILQEIEEQYCRQAMDAYETKKEAAEAIGINRTTLVEKCRRLGIGENNQ
jgi:DNA-binding NtrC family response regulator